MHAYIHTYINSFIRFRNNFLTRRTAVDFGVPLLTNAQLFKMFVESLRKHKEGKVQFTQVRYTYVHTYIHTCMYVCMYASYITCMPNYKKNMNTCMYVCSMYMYVQLQEEYVCVYVCMYVCIFQLN